jgi:adenine deaminase
MPDLELVDVALGRSPADLVIRGGTLVNVFTEETYPADVAVSGSKIAAVGDVSGQTGPGTRVVDAAGSFLVPGLIDGHLHVECGKLSVTMFANAVVPLGTTSIVSGLDQIFVVAGLEGVREFLDEAASGPLGVFWGAPSKLPYTLPESTVGHTFGPAEHALAQQWPECVALWETVQEFVFERDPKVLEAIDLAARHRLPVMSCAPLAEGAKIAALACAGFRADHECYSAEETLAKLRNGMYAMIRESSVAHFLTENLRVITEHKAKADRIGFCTDDVTATDILSRGTSTIWCGWPSRRAWSRCARFRWQRSTARRSTRSTTSSDRYPQAGWPTCCWSTISRTSGPGRSWPRGRSWPPAAR